MKWVALLLLSACAGVRAVPSTPLRVRTEQLALAGVVSCDGSPTVTLNPARPLAILVHGLHGGDFAALAEAFLADGQQPVCFRYDGRANLLHSARRLRAVMEHLATVVRPPEILLFGHSQGGLVARAALARSERPLPSGRYRLVTASSPFAGIRVARACGSLPYHLVSFGVSYAVCRAISGDSWNQIHPGATMVRAPSQLDAAVSEHLLLVTDERDTCRRYSADGLHCLQDDYVFSEREQHNALIEHDLRVIMSPIAAGHVEIVGAHGPPRKLVEALHRHGLLQASDERATLFEAQSAKAGW